jgi:hypothetical protein
VSLGAAHVEVTLEPEQPVTFVVPAPDPVPGENGFAYLMRTRSARGFVPHLRIGNGDYRNLGAQVHFRAEYR